MNCSMITALQFSRADVLVHNEDVMIKNDTSCPTGRAGRVSEQGKPLAMPLQAAKIRFRLPR